ncbi:MAG TPA: hypothetical protein VII83_01095 [Gaiellaceae bacterium]
MKGWKRAGTTLAGSAAAGALIWFVPHFDRWSTGGYWGAMATFAAAGLVLGVAQLRGREGSAIAMFLIVFVPVLIVGGWVVLAAQPRGDWFRNQIVSWSSDIGVDHAVRNLGEHVTVLAFGIGLVFGLMFEPAMIRRRRTVAAPVVAPASTTSMPPVETPASEEPTRVETSKTAEPESAAAEPTEPDAPS